MDSEPTIKDLGRGELHLSETLDVGAIQSLMEDFHRLTEIPMALIDLQGKVLAGAGWQKICTEFHRRHPEALQHCIESDTRLTTGIREGDYRIYKCMNNMWDAATPIMVAGVHTANLFTGQFFFDDELPNEDLFRAQAARYGFPEEEYVTALNAVPRLNRNSVENALAYFTKIATLISQLSQSNARLTSTLAEQDSLLQSLEKSRQRLAGAQELAHLGSWELDLLRNELTWSDEVYRIFGLQPQEFEATYEAFLEAVHPDDRAAVDAAYSRSLRENLDTYEIEHRVVRRSGDVRYVHEKCEHFRNENGEVVRSVGMVHDITERRLAEAALRDSDLTYRQIIDSIPGLVFTMTPEGMLEYQNQQFDDFTGVPIREHSGAGWNRLLHPDDRSIAFGAWRSALQKRSPYDLEHRVRRRDGAYEWFKVHCRPIRNQAGEVVRWFGTALNIDKLVQAREELSQAKSAAEAATRAKSEFLANMSHEIRTPMNAIIGMTELTLDTPLSPQQREYLQMVQSSAESLLKVINDILDFSKIEAGLLEFETAEFDPRDLVEKTAQILALRAHQKGLELACRIDPSVPGALMGDAGRLRQVLTNLIGNAIKFTEAGEILVRVEMLEEDGNACRLRFSVKDTGIGIPADKMSLLFRQFSQIDSSAARRFHGTGLGLAISRQIVEKMGGEIRADSAEGKGNLFSFTAAFDLAHPRENGFCLEPDLEGMRALIIDDNESNRHILSEILSGWGMAPTTAATGEEGIARLHSAAKAGVPFRLLLLDALMPKMDGFEVAEKIRKENRYPEMNIMMLSSGEVPAAIERCRRIGIDRYLIKPLRRSELFNILVETFSQRSLPSAPRRGEQEAASRSAPGALRILLAEDNGINQMLARTLLEKRGWSVMVASTGEESVALWRQEKPDLILMDVQMPGMDGLQATRLIRQEERGGAERTPIIGLTAHAMKGDREVCLEAGMDDYVPKPVRAQSLYAAVEHWLSEEAPAVDLSYALKSVAEDKALLAELAEQFAGECPVMTGKLTSALAESNFSAIERTAHSLKAAVAIFGAQKAARMLQDLELAARDRLPDLTEQIVPQVLSELKRVQEKLSPLSFEEQVEEPSRFYRT